MRNNLSIISPNFDSQAEMLSERLRRPEVGEQGRWWSTTEILTLQQQANDKSTLSSEYQI